MTERTPQQTADLVRERMFANDRASKALGMRVVEMSPGQATLTMTVREDMLNGHDICHGGFTAALAEEVDKLAQKLSTMPAKALAATREVFDAAQHLTLEQALDAEAQVQGQLGRAHDYLEGVAAFSAKRAAVFTDR